MCFYLIYALIYALIVDKMFNFTHGEGAGPSPIGEKKYIPRHRAYRYLVSVDDRRSISFCLSDLVVCFPASYYFLHYYAVSPTFLLSQGRSSILAHIRQGALQSLSILIKSRLNCEVTIFISQSQNVITKSQVRV